MVNRGQIVISFHYTMIADHHRNGGTIHGHWRGAVTTFKTITIWEIDFRSFKSIG